jgi:colanic acid/amylovoran biosynthesis glycosyltransferase
MRALHSFPIWLPQTQTWMYNQIRYLPKEVESHIICEITENLGQFWLPNIHSLSAASLWRYYWDLWLKRIGIRNHLGYLVRQAVKYHADLLHSHFGNVGWENLAAAKKASVRHVVTFYGFDVSYLLEMDATWYKRYQTLFKDADRFLCEGPHMANCIEALGCPAKKIIIHHLGVNIGEILFKPRCWCPGGPLRVLIAASFREKKGIPYALEALERLSKEVPLEITLIGDAHPEERSQEEKRKILQKIEHLGLQSRVRRLGYQPYQVFLEEAYKHHVFLSPSITASDGDTEGGAPVSITEMVASGMPVISTFHCDIPEIIQHGVSGLLAEERDVEGLVKHLRWLIEHADSWSQMIEAGRNHVAAEFDARKQGEKLAQIYQELISS